MYARNQIVFALISVLLMGCTSADEYVRVTGATMGTQYSVTAKCKSLPRPLEPELAAVLSSVNREMSNYDPESMLSRFNHKPVGSWHEISDSLADVIEAAQSLSVASDGAFDVTVGPLVNLWGFGPVGDREDLPDEREITAALANVGYRHLSLRRSVAAGGSAELQKGVSVYVDLSAIAKGHGVDRIAQHIEHLGCLDYLVDIGGEVRVAGVNPQGKAWRIGVEVPAAGNFGGVARVLELSQGAVATSGDYRNFMAVNGKRYSHTIDPRTGYPVTHDLASVSVVHPSAMWADGYATTLSVLGAEAGLDFARKENLAALFIIRTASGFQERYTARMKRYVDPPTGSNNSSNNSSNISSNNGSNNNSDKRSK
ncbi:MAG: FAD:protein FMN transferase [Gammaproteobacteria bacterium]|nr:FAD:protein FMN transferase [Gammaproteobacteria bacterium]